MMPWKYSPQTELPPMTKGLVELESAPVMGTELARTPLT